MTSERECFSCGATQVDVAEHELNRRIPRHVRLCEPCARTYWKAGLLAPRPAIASTDPGHPQTG